MNEPSKKQLVSDLRDAQREIAEMRQELALAEPFIGVVVCETCINGRVLTPFGRDLIRQLRDLQHRIESLEYRVPEDMD